MNPYYSKKIIEHFLHPKNFGKIKNASGIGDTQNLKCGDVMKIYIEVKEGVIEDAKFETFGCGHAISISDMICDLVKGKALEEALKIGYKDIADEVGLLPPQKVHCAHLAERGMRMAIEDYYKKLKAKS